MKKAIITALITAMTLCSCGGGKQPDIKKDYKKYLDYTFDGQYSISDSTKRSTDNFTELVWMISYTDLNGKEQTDEISVPDIDAGDEELIKSEYDWAVMNFVSNICNTAVHNELMDKLLSPYFEITENTGLRSASGDGFTVYFEYINCDLFDPDDETVAAALDPENGIKYAGVNLKDWAQDERHGIRVSFVIDDAERTEEFAEKLTEFGSDYVEYTVSPQNYCFELHAPDSSGESQLVAAGCRVLGKETNATLFDMQYIINEMG